ncbi:MAG: SCP2 sterol-binding domain-containing protein [Gemmatimonadaceae bacterium]
MLFLSDEHFAAANAAFVTDSDLQRSLPGVTLGIVYFVSDAVGGDFLYHIRIADGAVTMAKGDLAERDAEVRSSYETAARMSRGEIANQTAVMMGKVRIKGGMMTLLKHQGVLNRVQAISSGLADSY